MTEHLIGAPAAGLDVSSAVGLPTSIVLLAVVVLGATIVAGRQLRSLRFTSEE